MKIAICLGSSCHVKGSKAIVDLFKAALKKHDLEKQVELCGSICMGQCATNGVNIKIDDELVEGGVSKETFDSFFNARVLSKLKN